MQRLKVSASCPACGAPLELLEGADVAGCAFCGLPLLFRSQKKILRYYLEPKLKRRSISFLVDRYRKENQESLPKRIDRARLFYLPFWRFTAQAFYTIFSRPQPSPFSTMSEEEAIAEILVKDWDVNFTAHESNHLAIATLGMRPDWLKLKILTDPIHLRKQADVMSLEVSSSAARKRALKSLNFFLGRKKGPEDELVLKLLEERLSLIYFPLWVVDLVVPEGKFFQVIDAVTTRTLKQSPGYFDSKKNQTPDVERFHPLAIVAHRCPNCGWDLPVTAFHVVFPCNNCGRIWEVREGSYRQIRAEVVKPKEEPRPETRRSPGYYPFWVFELKFRQGRGSSIREVFELLPSEIGLFGALDKSRPFLFYVPAFELANLKKVAEIGLAYIRTQPQLETQNLRGENLEGVLIPEDDAKRMAELLWTNLISRKANLDLRTRMNPEFGRGRVIWCPCHRQGAFLRDAVIGYSFQRVE
jgi:predicted RNA-binding Zn-ribbon protein involved in translation (DUF1610 family)